MKTVIFAPHPDDEIIGCGGYAIKMIKDNNEVSVVYLKTPDNPPKNEIEQVKHYVGFHNIFFLNAGEGRYFQKSKKLIQKILDIIREMDPNTVLYPHENEQDQDHKFMQDIVSECTFLCNSGFMLKQGQKKVSIDNLLGYEVWTPIQKPSLYVDITDHIIDKTKAMEKYKSQKTIRDFTDMFKGLNRYRGVTSGVGDFAEAFEVYKIKNLTGEK